MTAEEAFTGLPLGLMLKAAGLAAVEAHAGDWLGMMRAEAVRVLTRQPTVSVVELREFAAKNGLEPPHKNCWGGIWQDRRFVWTGEWVTNPIPSAHARLVRTYRLR